MHQLVVRLADVSTTLSALTTMTWSPVSRWGRRSACACRAAGGPPRWQTRPSTMPSASTTCQGISLALGEYVASGRPAAPRKARAHRTGRVRGSRPPPNARPTVCEAGACGPGPVGRWRASPGRDPRRAPRCVSDARPRRVEAGHLCREAAVVAPAVEPTSPQAQAGSGRAAPARSGRRGPQRRRSHVPGRPLAAPDLDEIVPTIDRTIWWQKGGGLDLERGARRRRRRRPTGRRAPGHHGTGVASLRRRWGPAERGEVVLADERVAGQGHRRQVERRGRRARRWRPGTGRAPAGSGTCSGSAARAEKRASKSAAARHLRGRTTIAGPHSPLTARCSRARSRPSAGGRR